MKKNYFTLFIALAFSTITLGQFNGDFEAWSNDADGFLVPTGWEVNNTVGESATVTQATGHSGNFAAKFQSNNFGHGGSIETTIYTTNRAVSITGYWIVRNIQSVDFFMLGLSAKDSLDNNVSTINANSGFGESFTTWQPFTFYFSAYTGVPKSMHIYFQQAYSPASGSDYAVLDDLVLTFLDNVDEFGNILSDLQVYPTVSSGELNIQFSVTQRAQLKFEVYDLQGRKVSDISQDQYTLGTYTAPIHLDLNDGIYLLRATGEKGTQTRNFAIQQ